jgi:hypothetical protein
MIYEPLTEIDLNTVYPTFDIIAELANFDMKLADGNRTLYGQAKALKTQGMIEAFGHDWNTTGTYTTRDTYEKAYRATRARFNTLVAFDTEGDLMQDAIWNLITEVEQKRDNVERYVNPSKKARAELAAVTSFFNYVHPE